jgi:ubiquinone/menaquinone biosynthesis C-methylase UbiE
VSPGLAPVGTKPSMQKGYNFMVLDPSVGYKKEEAAQADKKAISANNGSSNNIYDLLLQSAHLHFEKLVRDNVSVNPTGVMLDFGCGTGSRTVHLIPAGWSLIGIDISKESINIAQSQGAAITQATEYLVMDGEAMSFSNNKFDLIVDYGSFSSLKMDLAIPEMVRVLKPGGSLIAIETLGHNLLFNCKRKWNVLRGNRTTWAADHIMKKAEWRKLSAHFETVHIDYFGLTGLILVPLIRFLPNKIKIISAKIFILLGRNLINGTRIKPVKPK